MRVLLSTIGSRGDVHHGGAGTTTTAALAGAPQVVIPQIYDQHYWAQRIHHLGIGTAHPAYQPPNR
jgi:vancomycin aglycone glucosyltransferase